MIEDQHSPAAKARRAREPYVKASPVTITKPDGTVEVQPALDPWQLAKAKAKRKRSKPGK